MNQNPVHDTDGLSAAQRKLLEKLMAEHGAGAPEVIRPRADRNSWPLSFAQQRLWFLQQLEPESVAYNNPIAVRLRGRFDAPAMERALREIIRRHEVLRSSIRAVDGSPVQTIHPEPRFNLPVIDLTHFAPQQREAELWRLMGAEVRRPMNVEEGPLVRGNLLRLGEQDHVLMLSIHHVVMDGWSLGVLANEMALFYHAFAEGKACSLPPLKIQYADYAQWQKEWMEGGKIDEQLRFWKAQLGDAPAGFELPTDRPRPAIQTARGTARALRFPAELTSSLRRLGQRESATLYMVLLAAFEVLLSRYSGQEDICIGTPIAGRNQAEAEALIGLFLNTLVIRARLEGNPTFRELLKRVKRTALDGYARQDVPFEKLVEVLHPQRDLSRSPIFQVMFILQVPVKADQVAGLQMEMLEMDYSASKYDLTLFLAETEGTLRGFFEYNTDLFEAATIERMEGHLLTLLEAIVADPDRRISDLALVGKAERERVLVEWNDTASGYSAGCIHELIEAQAERTPDAVAVSFEGRELTYSELNGRANQLASYLRGLGAGPDKLIGLLAERSAEMVVALLGILKSGAAYVPLDPAYPAERIAYMLEDAGAEILVTEEKLTAGMATRAQVVCLDRDWPRIARESAAAVAPVSRPEDLAYVIYTSGSTGRPKGVMIEHRQVVNFLESMQREPGLRREDVLLAVTTLSFDIAGLEMYLPLITGARLEIVSREVAIDGRRLEAELLRSGATVMQATPATWRLLLEAGWRGDGRLKVLCGGEAMPGELAAELVKRAGSVWNVYGPTETTIWSTVKRVEGNPSGTVSIGRPIANTSVYIVDRQGEPAPIGVAGELLIGGAGVARGYWQRAELTAEKFIPNRYTKEGRVYRTGDLARWRADGTLEYLGRMDTQVKVRGYRIELGEIEAALGECAGVRQSVVVTREDQPGNARIVAYLIAEAGAAPEAGELRNQLRRRLPEYMVPSAFVTLERLPLTPNGKVDRKALPAPVQTRTDNNAYQAPQSEIEATIAGIWSEILGFERVGRDDNFFDLGGHSLLLTQVHNRLSKVVDRELTIIDLFRFPTVSTLASYLSELGKTGDVNQTALVVSAKRTRRETEPIAIIGMAGRFPGAQNPEELWHLLRDGVEAITPFSKEELRERGVDASTMDQPGYVPASAVLKQPEYFDAGFFGLTPREAEVTDPQHRVFLECAQEALESAAYDPQTYAGRIGVFAGVGLSSYLLNNLVPNPEAVAGVGAYQVFISNDKDFVPTRASYKLNLRGPSVNVQTACSTSLVAIHMAGQSLLNGECDIALAGGVSINATQAGYTYQEGAILSPDGHCRPFDARAEGTCPGSGAGLVVLKRLSDAEADGDNIQAVILGSAINNDGSMKIGYTAPSVEGQAAVIAEAQAAANIEPESVSYVEAHGTGTRLGDPIEVTALTQAFRLKTEARQFCALGSLKSNMGHLDTAAGVAGLIKTTLQLRERKIAPSLHFEQPNPKIDFAGSPFFVNDRLRDWRSDNGPLRAGVSSFGIGGTNAHVVLQEAPAVRESGPSRPWQLMLLSAKTATALHTSGTNLGRYLSAQPGVKLADAAWTTQVGRTGYNQRRAVLCRTHEEGIAALSNLDAQRVWTGSSESGRRSVAFLFPGQGTQYPGMGRELYECEPRFREDIDRCAEILKRHLGGRDIRDLVWPKADEFEEAETQLSQTWLSQPALFTIEHALANLWMSWGVRPQVMLGHSIGEYVAACIAGVMTLEEALAIVATRGRLMQALPRGAMLAAELNDDEARLLTGDRISLAAVNGPLSRVLSGPADAIAQVEQQLAASGKNYRRLHTSHAFHSQMMDPVLEIFAEEVAKAKLRPPAIPFISNVTGAPIRAEEATDPQYWARHLRSCVRFHDGLGELCKESRSFLEIGPGQALSSLLRRHPAKKDSHTILTSMRHPQEQRSDAEVLTGALARFWVSGGSVDWNAYSKHEVRRRVALPSYPFERQRYWIEPRKQPAVAASPLASPPVGKKSDVSDWFYLPAWKQGTPAEFLSSKGKLEGDWLLFLDDCGAGRALAKRLRAEGARVATVSAGSRFSFADAHYTLRPDVREDYFTLVQELAEHSRKPRHVVHLWSLTSDLPDGFDQNLGYYSLIYLAAALGEAVESGSTEISVVSNHVQDVSGSEPLCPAKAALLGPSLVISQEYPSLSCRNIDAAFDSKIAADGLAEQMFAEITSSESSRVVAWRGRQRWVQSFDAIRLEPATDGPRLRKRGTYLITGGLGNVGLSIASYLAKAAQPRLVLLGRSAFPDRAQWEKWLTTHDSADRTSGVIQKLMDCEESGAEITVLQADASDPKQMCGAVQQILQMHGSLNGVVHAAGAMAGDAFNYIHELDRSRSERQLRPKLQGAAALEEAVTGIDLDFCLLTSSISVVLGGMRFAAYAAANIAMDAFVREHNRKAAVPWTAVNWDAWKFTEATDPSSTAGSVASLALSPREGGQVLDRILSRRAVSRLVVSTASLDGRIRQWVEPETSKKDTDGGAVRSVSPTVSPAGHARPNLQSAYAAPGGDIESKITAVWEDLIGVTGIGVHDDYFELGGHSLLAPQILTRLRETFHIDLPLRILFETPTVSGLAAAVGERMNVKPGPKKNVIAASSEIDEEAKLLERLGELSEEEIGGMLDNMLAGKDGD